MSGLDSISFLMCVCAFFFCEGAIWIQTAICPYNRVRIDWVGVTLRYVNWDGIRGSSIIFFLNGICLRKTNITHEAYCTRIALQWLSFVTHFTLNSFYSFRIPGHFNTMSMSSSISIRNIVISFYFSIENKNWFVVVHL